MGLQKTVGVILIVLVSLLLNSCETKVGEWTTLLEGTVSDFYTGKKLPSIGLIIDECSTSLVVATRCETRDTLYSNPDGSYSYNLTSVYSEKMFDINNFQISVIQSDYYGNSDAFEIEKEENNKINFKVKPLRVLRVILQDSSKMSDRLDLYVSKTYSNVKNAFEQEVSLTDLAEVDTVLLKCIPDEVHYISWRSYKSGDYVSGSYYNEYIGNKDTVDIAIRH